MALESLSPVELSGIDQRQEGMHALKLARLLLAFPSFSVSETPLPSSFSVSGTLHL